MRTGLAVKMIVVMAALSLTVSGCAQSGAHNQEGVKTTEKKGEGGAAEILFWHSMGGANQEKLQKVVDGFNSSQSEYRVVAENQGTYDESTSKFFNMNGGQGSPALIQIGEQNLQSMIDSGLIASVSKMIEEYQYDDSGLLPQAVNFYTVDETMYAMPFNCSSPVIYYNEEALKKAGLSSAPATFEEILAAAPLIMEVNSGMKAMGMHAYGYALDQMVTNMGGLTVNNDNGRSGRTTEVAYQDQILTIFTWISDLLQANALINYGASGDNVVSGFHNQDFAMFISTSASAANIISTASFQVGVAPLPVPEGIEPQGVYAGGGALCVAEGLDQATAKGVMKFLEYGTSAEVQASWAGDTGYFPINSQSYETETMTEIYTKTPQLKVAADQLLNSKQTKATAGPLLSSLPQLRNDLQAAEEMVFNGGNPKEAVDQAVKNTNKQIETANKSVK